MIIYESNPELSKKWNIRDYTDLLHLVILNNLENTSTKDTLQRERLINLNIFSRMGYKVIKELELL